MIKRAIFIFTLLLVLFPGVALAWDDCPRDNVNCTGECNLFIDTNNDGICDHSQPDPGIITSTSGLADNQSNVSMISQKPQIGENPAAKSQYSLIPLSIVLLALYFTSYFLAQKKIIGVVNHRKGWNILLLAAFLVSGLLGLFLVVRINFGIVTPLPFNILYWHVQAGIAMAIISIFHIVWHLNYFKTLLKR